MSQTDLEYKLEKLKAIEPELVTEETFLPEQMKSAKDSHATAHKMWSENVSKLEASIADETDNGGVIIPSASKSAAPKIAGI